MSTVVVNALAKRFADVQAVTDVSFNVEPGEIFGLLGPNGAGKTTTIRMMLDIFKPDQGSIEIFGGQLDVNGKRRIGYLPEERGLYKDQKLESTLIYLAQLKGVDKRSANTRLDCWLERFDLAEHRQKKVSELSHGMQQKSQLIAALLHNPDLLIVDEPFSGLDPVNTRLVKGILEELRAAGKSIIMSTHQMHQVEALCNRIVLIDQGRSVLYGLVHEIKRNFAGNAVLLQGQGDFEHLPGVLDERKENGSWHLTLQKGTDPQELLRALTSRENLQLQRFELAEPSLEDIFVHVVGDMPLDNKWLEREHSHA